MVVRGVARALIIAIHRKPHTVLRCLVVQPRTVFDNAPCLKLSVDGYIAISWVFLSARAAFLWRYCPRVAKNPVIRQKSRYTHPSASFTRRTSP